MVQEVEITEVEITEVEIDGRAFWVRSVRPGVLKSSHMGRVLPW